MSVATILSLFPKEGRSIGEIEPDLVIEEVTSDTYEVTSHPVQSGASINDHKYRKPITLKITMMQSNDFTMSIEEKYKELLDLQDSSEPFDVTTPKRIYKNMIIKSLGVTTDRNTENVLSVSLELQEVIIVDVTVTNVPARKKQKKAGKTGKTEKGGTKIAKSPSTTGADALSTKKKSALASLFGG